MRKFQISYFILGVLFILMALLAFRDPAGDLIALVIFFGMIALIKGFFELFYRKKMEEFTGSSKNWVIFMGIVDLLFGLILLFNIPLGLIALPFVFSFWFILDSIGALMIASKFQKVSNGYYYFMLAISIIGILVGLLLLFNPLSAALTLAFLVGFYFMMIGISFITAAF
ncbi:HdeD family acid-resistance protein [uncultured Enterococcus sp.]|uniref:HdeD family acid-resistance protein n=1 Tax=uncultured Enterococcus sp. TaxID=167972 RepID=UPI0025DB095E|nr:DUF308 domain-containing protein [uncultured Enterococcus sp.]